MSRRFRRSILDLGPKVALGRRGVVRGRSRINKIREHLSVVCSLGSCPYQLLKKTGCALARGAAGAEFSIALFTVLGNSI